MIDTQVVLGQLAEHLREIATRQGNVPFRTGDLRKSVVVQEVTARTALVGSNLPYARPVHDGRPALVIKPKRKKLLAFPAPAGWGGPVGRDGRALARQVRQPARPGNPFLARAAAQMAAAPLPPAIRARTGEAVAQALEAHFRAAGLQVVRR